MTKFPLKQKLEYKIRYYKRIIWRMVGFCEKCNHKLDYTSNGRGICSQCTH